MTRSVVDATTEQEVPTVSSDQDQQKAVKRFKQEERARDGRMAMTEYETQARATRAKTERLKALRLAAEAQALIDAPPAAPAKRAPRRKITAP
jgi:hypothetical protein